MSDVSIRRAETRDLPALLDIYNHYVVNTPITFDIEPRTLAQRQRMVRRSSNRPAAINVSSRCAAMRPSAGHARAGSRRSAAYDTSVETSIYLAPDEGGKGLGRRLYGALFEALKGEDIHRAFGGVTQPNEASVGLHRAMGFAPRRHL